MAATSPPRAPRAGLACRHAVMPRLIIYRFIAGPTSPGPWVAQAKGRRRRAVPRVVGQPPGPAPAALGQCAAFALSGPGAWASKGGARARGGRSTILTPVIPWAANLNPGQLKAIRQSTRQPHSAHATDGHAIGMPSYAIMHALRIRSEFRTKTAAGGGTNQCAGAVGCGGLGGCQWGRPGGWAASEPLRPRAVLARRQLGRPMHNMPAPPALGDLQLSEINAHVCA